MDVRRLIAKAGAFLPRRPEQALEVLDDAILSLMRSRDVGRLNLVARHAAVIADNNGYPDVAIQYYEMLRGVDPNDTTLLMALALCYESAGRFADAKNTLATAIQCTPTDDREMADAARAAMIRVAALKDAETTEPSSTPSGADDPDDDN